MFDRSMITKDLNRLFRANPAILAVWEGGSAATGFLDEFSDLDLSIICVDDAVETVFQQLEEHLKTIYGIRRKFRIPEPAWHGFSQCFYQIDQVPPLFYLDIAVIKASLPEKFTEPDRHGNAVIWFDPKSFINHALQLMKLWKNGVEWHSKTRLRVTS
ncbi:MAG: hypothetical protein MZU97_05195 [Bacillus subtilis]|nr:hypothetical protein [Bacillus subtilis]